MSSKKPISTAPVYQLKVTLKGSSPRIWRRILVGGDASLAKLHRILQAAMGWSDSHLHLFKIHGEEYGTPDEDEELDIADDRRVKLADLLGPKDRFMYEYDFGDCWLHEILVEKIVPREEGTRYPLCVAGARACPPEDCGGIGGYFNFLEAIEDPDHEEHENLLEWIGGSFDPEEFDLDHINTALKRFK
jgi:hypothetical protein